MAKRDSKGRFVKGQSGNPLGRAKRKSEDEYLAALSKRVSLRDWLAVVDKAIELAKSEGDWRARQWLSDYLIGKPTQRIEHTGEGGAGIEYIVKVISGVDEERL
ncbi:MAG: hypothetical protein H8D74_01155 [Chloroflexi bacterium]|nr:hypothetical protein [Chloroflexota bacterium]